MFKITLVNNDGSRQSFPAKNFMLDMNECRKMGNEHNDLKEIIVEEYFASDSSNRDVRMLGLEGD